MRVEGAAEAMVAVSSEKWAAVSATVLLLGAWLSVAFVSGVPLERARRSAQYTSRGLTSTLNAFKGTSVERSFGAVVYLSSSLPQSERDDAMACPPRFPSL